MRRGRAALLEALLWRVEWLLAALRCRLRACSASGEGGCPLEGFMRARGLLDVPVRREAAVRSEVVGVLVSRQASAKVELGSLRALNGALFDYHGRVWWCEDSCAGESEVAKRRSIRPLEVGGSVALAGSVGKDVAGCVEGRAGPEGRGSP